MTEFKISDKNALERCFESLRSSAGAALDTVVGVFIEVPVMLMLVRLSVNTQSWFPDDPIDVNRNDAIVENPLIRLSSSLAESKN